MDKPRPYREETVIDMRIDGSFPPRAGTPLPMKVAGIAITIATIAGALALAALIVWIVLWAIMVLVPVTLVAGAVGWLAYRYQVWKRGGAHGGPRDVFRR